jgi:molybdopterin synthase sulfur carrier subunit
MTNIHVEYFAILREHVGRSHESLETNSRTVADLYHELDRRYKFPEVAHMKVAINDEFGEWDSVLTDGDSVVFIPPVAGG